jgi:uracil-DNA glycosylase family 4
VGGNFVSELTDLYVEIARCTRCALSQSRVKTVPGEGPENADIMFIGEAPGFHENQQGRPFVGAAGKFLDELLASIDLHREDVYICNVIKCRPPGNRDPLSEEIEACRPFLDRQIELIQPKIIVTLGRYSMARYFSNAKISQIHGRPRKMGGIIYYPMYHPAAALHQPRYRADIERDMLKIPQLLAEIDRMADDEKPPQAEQLSLF